MLDQYKTVYMEGEGEIVEKKSRFLAHIVPVSSEEEALDFIEKMKKKYWDARHNCFAYRVGEHNECTRASDDGEPSGTAGRPMLEVLVREELQNVCVVVTRYFGGVLLGTGGLVRAYTEAVQAGLQNCIVVEKKRAYRLRLFCDYGGMGRLLYLLGQLELPVLDTQYTEQVELQFLVPATLRESFDRKLTETFSATLVPELLQELYYDRLGREVVLFES